jgi:prevent-host-death family protein
MVCMTVLPIGEARRRLPELVRKVAEGHPPVAIGRRGKVEAVLSAPRASLETRRVPLSGLVTILDDDFEAADRELLEMFASSVARTAREIGSPRRRRPRAR